MVKKMIKMKLKTSTSTSLLVLYVCYWPGLEDRSSGPGIGHAHILRLFEVGQEK
jgi:hypothetical protein